MKNPPKDLGIWIAYGSMIPGGVDAIIKRCLELGFSWIAPRLGNGAQRDSWYTPAIAKKFCDKAHEAGLKVYPWIFNHPTAMNGELMLYKACLEEGADGLFLDAEVPYKNKKAEAKVFVSLLKKEFPDVWIGNAPFSYIEWHPDYPYVEFSALDAACDQLYHTEFDKNSCEFHTKKVDGHWGRFKKKHPTSCPRWPIGVTYGSELGPKWKMSKAPPGSIKVEDVKFFLNHYDGLPISLYSLEALDSNVAEFLKNRAAERLKPISQPEPMSYRDPVKETYFIEPVEDNSVEIDVVVEEKQKPVTADVVVAPSPSKNHLAALFTFIATLFRAFFSGGK